VSQMFFSYCSEPRRNPVESKRMSAISKPLFRPAFSKLESCAGHGGGARQLHPVRAVMPPGVGVLDGISHANLGSRTAGRFPLELILFLICSSNGCMTKSKQPSVSNRPLFDVKFLATVSPQVCWVNTEETLNPSFVKCG